MMVMVIKMMWTTKTMAMIDVGHLDDDDDYGDAADDDDNDDDDDDDDDDDLSGVAFKYWSFDNLLSLYLFSGIVFRRIACPIVHHGNFQTIPIEKERFYFKRTHHILLTCFYNLTVVNDMIAEQNV